ncbi:major Facilitator Superfamily protein [Rhodotorula toruloides]|uniref:Major Facilitator Superfamily protein n=1 Tax=Rhodotorula toruloides TaxID=5286 RepID=A0A511KB39_RHOTO|nr:major Facilitator Superfamily protein [Rhodotorula toruloides]
MPGDAIELVWRAGDESRTTLAPIEHRSRLDSSVDEKTLSGTETVADETKVVIDGAGIGERELEALPKDARAREDDAAFPGLECRDPSPGRPEPPTGIKLFFLLVALASTHFASSRNRTADPARPQMLVEVLVGLDNTIVATATGTIANHFNALGDVGFYGAAYLLTCVAFQPLAGRAYAYYPQKLVFLIGLVIFEVGAVVAGCATSSAMVIVGRAIQGLGYSSLFIGILAICANTLPIRTQAVVTSLMNVSYGSGTVLGPLIGGALTSKVSWRWTFWINAPVGVFAAILVVLLCHPPLIPQTLPNRTRIARMDWGGALLLLGSMVCLLVALQEGGIKTAWSSGRMIGLLVGFAVLFVAFFALQTYLGESSSISIRLLTRNRSMAATSLVNFCCGASYYALLYYIPIRSQTVDGASPVRAGIELLPLIFFNMTAGIIAGWTVSKWGMVQPAMLVGTSFTAIGAGLHASMNENTTEGQWIGYGIVVGTGMGALYMMSFLASQMLVDEADKSKASSLVCFWQIFGGTVWVGASNAIYANKFKAGLGRISGINVQQVLDSGVDQFRQVVPPELLDSVIKVCIDALFDVFISCAILGAIGFVAVFGIRWVRIDDDKTEKREQEKAE